MAKSAIEARNVSLVKIEMLSQNVRILNNESTIGLGEERTVSGRQGEGWQVIKGDVFWSCC